MSVPVELRHFLWFNTGRLFKYGITGLPYIFIPKLIQSY